MTTEPHDFDATEAALPGLEPAPAKASPLELAARRTLAALSRAGRLEEHHAVLCQLILELAAVTDAGRRQGRASAAAMAAAQLQAAYVLLVPETESGGENDDAWSELVEDLRRSAAAVRDPA